MNKIVVYTCIIGDYDTLKPVCNRSSRIDYICFTDNPNIKSDGVWEIRRLPPDDLYTEGLSKIKKQRIVKILPHIYLKEYDVSIWVDGNIQITGNLIFEFLNVLDLNNHFMYVNRHPSRDCIYREEVDVLRRKKDLPENTNPQIRRYKEEGFPEHFGLAETNIIVRKHNDYRCKKLMFDWAKEIINGSHRDQLSFDYCRWKNGMSQFIGWIEENLHYTSKTGCFRIYSHGQNPIKLIGTTILPHIIIHKYEIDEKQKLEEEKKKLEEEKKKLIEEQKKKEEEFKKKLEEEKKKVLEEQLQKIEELEDKQEELESEKEKTDEKLEYLVKKLETTKNQLKALEELNRKFNELNKKYDLEKVNSEKIIEKFKTDKKQLIETIDSLKATIKKEKENKQLNDVISIVITTHNRTAVAQYTLAALLKNISYSGKIHWIICDDRSASGHIEALKAILAKNNISDYSICKTTSDAYGLGASLNNGLKAAFNVGQIVLTTEDDWLLVKKLNLDQYVATLKNDNIAGIRLATTSCENSLEKSEYDDYWKIKKDNGRQYIFNNQVMLRHKRIYDLIGYNKENCSADEQESDMCKRFNAFTNFGSSMQVLYPKILDKNPALYGKNNFFHHIGKSTINKNRFVSAEYDYLNDKKLDEKIRKQYISDFSFCIITAVHNSIKTLERCSKSILSQTFKNYKWVVVDDNSDDESYSYIENLAKTNASIELRKNNGNGMGAAWNTGLIGCDAYDYVLFLDSDDYYTRNNALEIINNKLKNSNEQLDCLLISYVSEFNNRNIIFRANNWEYAINHHATAPWSKCIKSEIYTHKECQFPINQRCCNDTIEDFYIFTYAKNIDSISTPLIYYSKSSPNSVWNNLTEDGKIPEHRTDAILAVRTTINNLNNISFKNSLLEFKRTEKIKILERYIPNSTYKQTHKPISILTCLFGNYDMLREPLVVSNDYEYVCVTDNPNLKSKIWKIIYLNKLQLKSDMFKTYYVKQHPFEFVKNKACLFIDASFLITTPNVFKLCDDFINSDYSFAIAANSMFKTLNDEINYWVKAFRNDIGNKHFSENDEMTQRRLLKKYNMEFDRATINGGLRLMKNNNKVRMFNAMVWNLLVSNPADGLDICRQDQPIISIAIKYSFDIDDCMVLTRKVFEGNPFQLYYHGNNVKKKPVPVDYNDVWFCNQKVKPYIVEDASKSK